MYFITIVGNVAGRTKKSVTGTVLFIAYCAGNCIGAQAFREKDARRYIPEIVVCSIMYGLEIVIMFSWRTYCTFCLTRACAITMADSQPGLSRRRVGGHLAIPNCIQAVIYHRQGCAYLLWCGACYGQAVLEVSLARFRREV